MLNKAKWRLVAVLPFVAAGIPPILIAFTIARYGFTVPVKDQWEFVPLLVEASEGKLPFAHLWAQLNEHRLVLPRLVMLALAHATSWDLRYELAANVVMALGVLGVLSALVRRTIHPLVPSLTPWLILAASLMTFSMTQWENWLWGWQLLMFMESLAAVVTVWALVRWDARWPGLAVALLAAVAAVFSYGTGFTLLAIVPVGLLLMPRCDEVQKRGLRLTVAGVVAATVVAIYFAGFQYPAHHPPPALLFSRPFSYGLYILGYAGAGLGFWRPLVAIAWGIVGLTAFAWCGIWLWTRSAAHRRSVLPWLLLALYALLSGMVTGIGRSGFGKAQALSSRYTTISSLFWVSVIVVVALAVAEALKAATMSRPREWTTVAVATFFVTLAGVSLGVSWAHAQIDILDQHAAHIKNAECVLYYDQAPDECLRNLFPDVRVVRAYAPQLKALGLGPFAPIRQERALGTYLLTNAPQPVGWVDQVVTDGSAVGAHHTADIVVSGWATDPFTQGPVRSVLVVVDGRVMGRTTTGEPRADVATAFGQRRLFRSGWTFRFGSFRLSPGVHRVEAYALLNDERRLVALAGSREVQAKR